MPRGRPKKNKEITVKSKETRAFFGFLLTFLGIAIFFTNSFDNTLLNSLILWVGQGTVVVSIIITIIGLRMISIEAFFTTTRFIWGLVILLISYTSFLQFGLLTHQTNRLILKSTGGKLGNITHSFLNDLMGSAGEIGILLLIFLVAISLLSGLSLQQLASVLSGLINFLVKAFEHVFYIAKSKIPDPDIIVNGPKESAKSIKIKDKEVAKKESVPEDSEPNIMQADLGIIGEDDSPGETLLTEKIPSEQTQKMSITYGKDLQNKGSTEDKTWEDETVKILFPEWKLPPVELLEKPVRDSIDNSSLKSKGRLIEETLKSFNIQAKVETIIVGPSVVQYALNIAVGTKVSKVQALSKDLGLALSAQSDNIRVDTIAGTPHVGIEVPRPKPRMVKIREVIESENFCDNKFQMPLTIGQNISGKYIIEDLASMPHLLIAGATGTGKSVTLNGIITGFLMRFTPDQLKMILVDPKMVELTLFDNIPHLLTPVITEKEKVINALDWAIFKMKERYRIFRQERVRNIVDYNNLGKSKMPYIIFIIDELADLMLVAKGDIEHKIVSLAQLARATGIHLILATQRPSVNVITGLIKANVPARIALGVSSGIDSRVIVDQQGAEKLLGKGDMLMKTAKSPKLVRIQGAYVDTEEINKVTNYIKAQTEIDMAEVYNDAVTSGGANIPVDGPMGTGPGSSKHSEDEMFRKAVEIVVSSGKVSSSSLQRYLKIGFNRAARLVDEMEAAGIVSEQRGNKRDLLMTSLEEIFGE